KNDVMKNDLPLLQIYAPKGDSPVKDLSDQDSTHNDSSKRDSMPQNISPKNDSPLTNSPKGDFVIKNLRVRDLPLEDDPNSNYLPLSNSSISSQRKDSPLPSDPLKTNPPLNKTIKSDFELLVPSKKKIQGVPGKDDQFTLSPNAAVKKLQLLLTKERAKTVIFRNVSSYLMKKIQSGKSELLNAKVLSRNMAAEMNDVNRHLLEIQVQQENVRKLLNECQGTLSGKVTYRLADVEANRLVKEEREPIIRYSHRNKYLKLLRELRRRIKEEVQKISRLVDDTTTTVNPTDGIFPTL
ncbi:hypothetical protein KR084_004182, partial [Drosophila pseudotakahashii]